MCYTFSSEGMEAEDLCACHMAWKKALRARLPDGVIFADVFLFFLQEEDGIRCSP